MKCSINDDDEMLFLNVDNEIRDLKCLVKRSRELVHHVVDPVWPLVWEGVVCYLDCTFGVSPESFELLNLMRGLYD